MILSLGFCCYVVEFQCQQCTLYRTTVFNVKIIHYDVRIHVCLSVAVCHIHCVSENNVAPFSLKIFAREQFVVRVCSQYCNYFGTGMFSSDRRYQILRIQPLVTSDGFGIHLICVDGTVPSMTIRQGYVRYYEVTSIGVQFSVYMVYFSII